MPKKLFVLSMDAMVTEDLAYLRTKPNFSALMADCAQVGEVRTIYPSITYPAHASIMTGCLPGTHGICTNTQFAPFVDPDLKFPRWYLYAKDLAVESIFAAAKRAGCTTASAFWPMTGLDPNVDWNIDEYFFYDAKGMTPAQNFARLGANEETLEVIRENMHRFPTWKDMSVLTLDNVFDDFLMGCAASLIRRQRPDVLFVHNCWLDATRHRHGVFGEKTDEALDRTDEWLGEIVQAMKDAGVYDETNFVILSDHGQIDIKQYKKLNTMLVRGGFADLSPSGDLYTYRAFSQSNGMSASVYLRFPDDRRLWQEVYDYLKALAAEGTHGFKEVFTKEEVAERYGWSGPFSFVVETDGQTAFSDAYDEPEEATIVLDSHRLGAATHGYLPEKGPQPVFVARGPAFKPGAFIPNARVIDEAPTFARILGQEMPQAQGRVLEELLRGL